MVFVQSLYIVNILIATIISNLYIKVLYILFFLKFILIFQIFYILNAIKTNYTRKKNVTFT